jgi:hypothetical protein
MQDRPRSAIPRPERINSYDLICTCNDPRLTCPVISHRKGVVPPSTYRQDFSAPKNKSHFPQFRPVDNLKTGDVFYDKTIYQQDYQAQNIDQLERNYQQNNRMHVKFTEENLGAHIKETLYLPGEKVEERVVKREAEFYQKPAKFIHTPEKYHKNKYEFQKDTEYTRMFKGLKRDNSADIRLNYDNLRTYPNLIVNAKTEYQDKIVARRNDPSPNRTLYELNKKANQFTQPMLPDHFAKPESEYHGNFRGFNYVKKQNFKGTPPIPEQFRHLSEYLYYDEVEGYWKLKKPEDRK